MKLSIADTYHKLINNGFPVAFYRLPGNKNFFLIAETKPHQSFALDDSDIEKMKGFVVYPFHDSKHFPPICIAPDVLKSFTKPDEVIEIEILENSPNDSQKKSEPEANFTSKETYTKWVSDAIKKIGEKEFSKAVLSGIHVHPVASNFDAFEFFIKLSAQYPDAFVYLIHSKQTGCWTGATPELLLRFNEKNMETVALAGTKFNNGTNVKNTWGAKEIDEQRLVAEHIQNNFEQHFDAPIEISETKTISTGHLLHLKTEFRMDISKSAEKKSLQNFLKSLHPTPAVAGNPTEKAIDFILQTETHNREYYTGFLGPVNLHDDSFLFVNLRCLKYTGKQIIIYTGAGITAASVPEQEWGEIQLKAGTILKVLNR